MSHVNPTCVQSFRFVLFTVFEGSKLKNKKKKKQKNWENQLFVILENEKFFELKSGGYRDGIKRKETR